METITSLQNPKIKHLVALQQKSSMRRESHLFVTEGLRELQHCREAGMKIATLYICPDICGDATTEQLATQFSSSTIHYVSPAVYAKMAYRGTTEGVMAEVCTPTRTLADLRLSKNPLIVVLESVEKPGNLGAILRSADAAGADAVIICDPLTDLYNPNLIRSSIGAIFWVPCIACSSEECIAWLKANKVKILTAQLQDSHQYYDTDMQCGTAIIMGTEATGLTDIWRKAADAHIRIPMLGQLDSLNVSVSAAVLLYEAVRQRATDSEKQ